MGHDISAYVVKKGTYDKHVEAVKEWRELTDEEKDDTDYPSMYDSRGPELAYFRIGAFDAERQRLFYNLLEGSSDFNGGVSGTGEYCVFPLSVIRKGLDAANYFFSDSESEQMHEIFLKPNSDASEAAMDMFAAALSTMFGKSLRDSVDATATKVAARTELTNNLKDVIEFYNSILSHEFSDDEELVIHFG